MPNAELRITSYGLQMGLQPKIIRHPSFVIRHSIGLAHFI